MSSWKQANQKCQEEKLLWVNRRITYVHTPKRSPQRCNVLSITMGPKRCNVLSISELDLHLLAHFCRDGLKEHWMVLSFWEDLGVCMLMIATDHSAFALQISGLVFLDSGQHMSDTWLSPMLVAAETTTWLAVLWTFICCFCQFWNWYFARLAITSFRFKKSESVYGCIRLQCMHNGKTEKAWTLAEKTSAVCWIHTEGLSVVQLFSEDVCSFANTLLCRKHQIET